MQPRPKGPDGPVLFDQTYKQFFAIAVENWSLGYRMDSGGGLRGRCLTSSYPQLPWSPYQWPTDEPYSVITENAGIFGEVHDRLCMLDWERSD